MVRNSSYMQLVFYIGTPERRCSVEDTQMEKGRQLCFFAKRCQGPNKTASAAEKFSVKECEEERD